MFGKIHIRKHELGLVFRKGDFRSLLRPGTHYLWSKLWGPLESTVEIVNTLDTLFKHLLADVLAKEPELSEALLVVDLNDKQRALVWRDGRLAYILGAGRFLLWRTPRELKVETFNVDDLQFQHPALETALGHSEAGKYLHVVNVEKHQEALFFRDGKLVDRLAQGRYAFWKDVGALNWVPVDLREQSIEVSGQEIMTRDKVTLRVNLVVTYRVEDTVKAVTVVSDHVQSLYREAQLVLRAAVGTRLLDTLLEDKESVGAEVREALARRAGEFGLAIRSVGLRDIILPGEMKAILNQVIEAEKQAQANLIRRREETAAARSQANTAKLLAENPLLARMRELEALQDILSGAKATFIFGDGDITRQIRGLVGSRPPEAESG